MDCVNRSYEGAPADGSAWLRGDCLARMLRGGNGLTLYDHGHGLTCACRDCSGETQAQATRFAALSLVLVIRSNNPRNSALFGLY